MVREEKREEEQRCAVHQPAQLTLGWHMFQFLARAQWQKGGDTSCSSQVQPADIEQVNAWLTFLDGAFLSRNMYTGTWICRTGAPVSTLYMSGLTRYCLTIWMPTSLLVL